AGDITVGSVTAGSAAALTATNGSILDAADDAVVDITAGGLITLTARTNIAGPGPGDSALELAAGSEVDASSTNAGNITLASPGPLTLADVDTVDGNITVTAAGALAATDVDADDAVALTATAGDITVGSVTAGSTATLTATNGSILDAADDAVVDITAGGLITLTARTNIAGPGPGDAALELAAGSQVDASSTNAGNITLASPGPLTLADVDTVDGNITVTAAGALAATDVDADDAVSLTATAGHITVGSVTSGSTATLTATNGSILDAADDAVVDITAGGLITLTAAGDIAGPGPGDSALELAAGSQVDASSTNAGNITLASPGALTLTDVDTVDGNITVAAAGALAATDVDADDAVALTASAGDITVGTVTAGSTVTLEATAGSILDAANDAVVDIAAGGSVTLTAAGSIAGPGPGNTALELAAGSQVDASSTVAGDILLAGAGALTLTDADAADGDVSVSAVGDIVVAAGDGITAASGDITLASGGDLAVNADLTALGPGDDVAAGGTITLQADPAMDLFTYRGDRVWRPRHLIELADVSVEGLAIVLGGGRANVPGSATIVAADGVELRAATITMGQREKLTVPDGGIAFTGVDVGGGAAIVLGDVTARDNIAFTAEGGIATITSAGGKAQQGGKIVASNRRVYDDPSVDVVARDGSVLFGAGVRVAGAPLEFAMGVGGEVPPAGGNVSGEYWNILKSPVADFGLRGDLDLDGDGGFETLVLDLNATGVESNPATALAGALPRVWIDVNTDADTITDAAMLRDLWTLGIRARELTAEERRQRIETLLIFNDLPARQAARPEDCLVSVPRLSGSIATQALALYHEVLMGSDQGDQWPALAAIRASLDAFARDTGSASFSAEAFRTYLSRSGTPEAQAHVARMEELYAMIRLLGLSQKELSNVNEMLLKPFAGLTLGGQALSTQQLEQLFNAWGTQSGLDDLIAAAGGE
ncbi:MAG: hypothetical protein GX591_14760, partial [Planctomycetes bacterium]|nr:hypothetical protein [Planctomycetota bacterium]